MNYSIAARTALFVAFVAINTSVFGPSISSIRDVFAKSSNREYYLFGLYPSNWIWIEKQTTKVTLQRLCRLRLSALVASSERKPYSGSIAIECRDLRLLQPVSAGRQRTGPARCRQCARSDHGEAAGYPRLDATSAPALARSLRQRRSADARSCE